VIVLPGSFSHGTTSMSISGDQPADENLGILRSPRCTGEEQFCKSDEPLSFFLQDFWQWSVSDLVSNATRGRLAEYLVAKALGISTTGVRDEWAAYDLATESGVKVEVKSAAYLQAWHQKRRSTISFSTHLSLAWDPETGETSATPARQADVYVFALLAHLEKKSLNPLDVAQWKFYTLATRTLAARTRSQHSITLRSLEELAQPVAFDALATAVEMAITGRSQTT
jgi:hypothetical protein